MLERTIPFRFLVVIFLVSGCTADRAVASRSTTTGGVGGGGLDGGGIDAPACGYGQIVCDGNVAKLCDGKGTFVQVLICTGECKDGLGCVNCVPNTGVCSNKLAAVCDSTGSRQISFTCDGPSTMCDQEKGCIGACSPATLGMGSKGCDFWPTPTANNVWGDGFHFGVVIGNVSTTSTMAVVKITGPGEPLPTQAGCDGQVCLKPGEVRAVPLSWVPELKGGTWQTPYRPTSPTDSVNSPTGAFHIVSDQPIVAYQFNPLEGTAAAAPACPSLMQGDSHCYSYSADASLLLPSHVLTSSYVAMGYHALHQNASNSTANVWNKFDMGDFVTITATQPDTTVWLNPRPMQSLLDLQGGPHLMPGQPIMLSLGAGQVVQFFTPGTSLDETFSGAEIVAAGQHIQVLSGVGCASIPYDPAHCGHIEDQVFPLESLGKDYVVPSLYDPFGSRIAHTIRVQAISDATAVTFEPTMLTGVTLARGEVVEIPNVMVDVRISSSVPFGVTQFVNSRSKAASNDLALSGPSQVAVAPNSQFRTSHSFAASPLYDANFVSVTAPTGTMVSLDGQPMPPEGFMAVGASGMSVARAPLTKNERVHVLAADKPVGVLVYGFAPYASYAYTGSLDLRRSAPMP